MERVIIFGRFPPPFDGQSLSAKRFADMIKSDYDVICVNSSVPSSAGWFTKTLSYVHTGKNLNEVLIRDAQARVVWQSISPQPSGHFRDLLTVLPIIRKRDVIAVVHWGSFHRLFESRLTRFTALRLANYIENFVFTDESRSDACSDWISDSKRVVIANSVDPETLCTAVEAEEKRNRNGSDIYRVLFLSNMISEKGYLDVLHAASILHENGANVHFDFVGEWYSENDRSAFDRIVEEKNLSDVVEHHGAVSDRSLIKRFHLDADIFVLPTYLREAQPLVIMEALSAGTPIVTTREGGIPLMVREGIEALYVPPKSPLSIADSISRLMNRSTWFEMSLNARKRFLEKYHPDVIRKQWIELIDSVKEDVESDEHKASVDPAQ